MAASVCSGSNLPEDGQSLTDVQGAQVETLTPAVVHAGRDEMHARRAAGTGRRDRTALPASAATEGSILRDERARMTAWAARSYPRSTRSAARAARSGGSVLGWPSTSMAAGIAPGMSPPTETRSVIDPVPDSCSTRSAKSACRTMRRRIGVIDDPLDLCSRERRVRARWTGSRPLVRPAATQHVDVVGQRVGEDVAGARGHGPAGACTSWWARPASSAKVSVTPDGEATTAGLIRDVPRRYATSRAAGPRGASWRNRVYQ